MTDTLTFTVQGHPVPLPRSRSAAGKRPYIPHDHPVRAWQTFVKVACLQEVVRREMPTPCYLGDVRMTCIFYGARKNADIDNLFKAVADALNGTAYADDSQIHWLTIERQQATEGNPEGAWIQIRKL